jgi:acyl carrier protein
MHKPRNYVARSKGFSNVIVVDKPTTTVGVLIRMGLDTVEIVLRTEETFNIDLPDNECSRAVMVGDLYRLMLNKLGLFYMEATEVEVENRGRDRSHLRVPSLSSWPPPDVWGTLKDIIVDQLQVDEEEEIEEGATFLRDLGSG